MSLLKSFILLKIISFDKISTGVVFSKAFRKYNLCQLPWQLEYSKVSCCLHFKLSDLGVLRDHILRVTQLQGHIREHSQITQPFTQWFLGNSSDPVVLRDTSSDPGVLWDNSSDPGVLRDNSSDPGVLWDNSSDPGVLWDNSSDPGVLWASSVASVNGVWEGLKIA